MYLQPEYTYHANEVLERFSCDLETTTPSGGNIKINVENNSLCIRTDYLPEWFDYILGWVCNLILLSFILIAVVFVIKFTIGIDDDILYIPIVMLISMLAMGIIFKCLYLIMSIINRKKEVMIDQRDVTYSITEQSNKPLNKSFPRNEADFGAPGTDLARVASDSYSFPTELCQLVLKKASFMSSDYSLSLNCCIGKEVMKRYICVMHKIDVITFVNIMNGSKG